MPPAELATPSASPVVTTASDSAQSAIVDQVKLMFASFQESLEARITNIDNRFSQISSSSALHRLLRIVRPAVRMPITALPAPSPVAMRSEHPPDRGPYTPYSDGLGSSLGGPATVSVSDDATSLPLMVFADLLATVKLLKSRSRVPDAFLDTLRSYVIVASDFNIAIGGASLADSICAFRIPDSPSCSGSVPGRRQYCPFSLSSRGVPRVVIVAMSTSALRHGGGGVL